MLTFGVEEEFFMVDSETGSLTGDATPAVTWLNSATDTKTGSYSSEFYRSSIESRTGICQSLTQVRQELVGLRRALLSAAATCGYRVISAGTPPIANWDSQVITSRPLYHQLESKYRHVIGNNCISACHVHVGIEDRDTAVVVMNRCRVWLPTILALSASSPFYRDIDTGYASYRSRLWCLFPIGGIPPEIQSWTDYENTIRSLIKFGTIIDGNQILWDLRVSQRHPTLEFRIADACTTVDEAVVIAGICRALVQTCMEEILSGSNAAEVPTELLTAARWHAGRYGLDADLIDISNGGTVPAATMVRRLLAHTRSALESTGDWDEVSMLTEQFLGRGSSSRRQRHVFSRRQSLRDVVEALAHETMV